MNKQYIGSRNEMSMVATTARNKFTSQFYSRFVFPQPWLATQSQVETHDETLTTSAATAAAVATCTSMLVKVSL